MRTTAFNGREFFLSSIMTVVIQIQLLELLIKLYGIFRLINGVFENYLTQKADGNMLSIVEAGDWFCFTDLLHTQIQTIQNYTVYPYLPYSFVSWHLLFAGISWPKITFPTQSFEVNRFS